MDDASLLSSTTEKWSEYISLWLLPSWVNYIIWSPSLRSWGSFGARVCAVVARWSHGIKLQTYHKNEQFNIYQHDNYFKWQKTFRKIVLEVPFVYMERAGFMTCTAASYQGTIKEPAASLLRTSETNEEDKLYVGRWKIVLLSHSLYIGCTLSSPRKLLWWI